MPTYEYSCENCGNFDSFEKISDERRTTCPTCGGPVKRVINAVGVIFKGSGFYTTDTRPSEKKETKDQAS